MIQSRASIAHSRPCRQLRDNVSRWKQLPAPRRCCCNATDQSGSSSGGSQDGNPKLQDALADVVNLRIGRAKTLAKLSEAVDDEKLKLIQKTDQAKEQLDNLGKLNTDRQNLAFGSTQADLDERFRSISSDLQASRERIEADARDFEAFQDKVQRDRQEGLWFKTLYARDKPKQLNGKGEDESKYIRAINDVTVKSIQRSGRKATYGVICFIAASGLVLELASGQAMFTWQTFSLAGLTLLAAYTAAQESSQSLVDALTKSQDKDDESKN